MSHSETVLYSTLSNAKKSMKSNQNCFLKSYFVMRKMQKLMQLVWLGGLTLREWLSTKVKIVKALRYGLQKPIVLLKTETI